MRMLLYQSGQEAVERDVAAEVGELSAILGTDQYEWMTVRFLQLCVIHDPEGKAAGKPLNRMLGKTPLYGDFLVCGIRWDNEGVTTAVGLIDEQAQLLRELIFNRIPEGEPDDNLPVYMRGRKAGK